MTDLILPATIVVGPHVYTVENWDPEDAGSRGQYGRTEHAPCRIRIDTHYDRSRTTETLVHELLHCIWYEWGLKDLDHDLEERVVNALGCGFVTVMRQNPKLLDLIQAIFVGDES